MEFIRKVIIIFISVGVIIWGTGFLGYGKYWGVRAAFGYGGGGGAVEPPLVIAVPKPIINNYDSETIEPHIVLSGIRAENTVIYINNSADSVSYPEILAWQSFHFLNLGENIFNVFAKDASGNVSETVMAVIIRYKIGDINRDGYVDDLDLALLAAHWAENWPKADFNKDKTVDDLDLAVLASHWDL